jgi:hypothetical protein
MLSGTVIFLFPLINKFLDAIVSGSPKIPSPSMGEG